MKFAKPREPRYGNAIIMNTLSGMKNPCSVYENTSLIIQLIGIMIKRILFGYRPTVIEMMNWKK